MPRHSMESGSEEVMAYRTSEVPNSVVQSVWTTGNLGSVGGTAGCLCGRGAAGRVARWGGGRRGLRELASHSEPGFLKNPANSYQFSFQLLDAPLAHGRCTVTRPILRRTTRRAVSALESERQATSCLSAKMKWRSSLVCLGYSRAEQQTPVRLREWPKLWRALALRHRR